MKTKYPTNAIKQALIQKLRQVPATSNGTQIADIVESGEDAFDKYPVIRVIPISVSNSIDEEKRANTYRVEFAVSVYLDLGVKGIPTKQIIDTLMEIVDSIYALVYSDQTWLPELEGSIQNVESTSTSNIDTTQSKTGTAVYCDIILPVSYVSAV